ncbi:MAG: hypothetical protein ABEJ40_06565 [Haloarculaceae archaeon]
MGPESNESDDPVESRRSESRLEPDESLDAEVRSGQDRDADRLPLDDLFELLAQPGNRYILTYLYRAEEPVTYSELIEYVVECTDLPAGATESEFRGRVATRLVHSNLPKLDDADLIDHDREAQEVGKTPRMDAIRPFLERAIEYDTAGT